MPEFKYYPEALPKTMPQVMQEDMKMTIIEVLPQVTEIDPKMAILFLFVTGIKTYTTVRNMNSASQTQQITNYDYSQATMTNQNQDANHNIPDLLIVSNTTTESQNSTLNTSILSIERNRFRQYISLSDLHTNTQIQPYNDFSINNFSNNMLNINQNYVAPDIMNSVINVLTSIPTNQTTLIPPNVIQVSEIIIPSVQHNSIFSHLQNAITEFQTNHPMISGGLIVASLFLLFHFRPENAVINRIMNLQHTSQNVSTPNVPVSNSNNVITNSNVPRFHISLRKTKLFLNLTQFFSRKI